MTTYAFTLDRRHLQVPKMATPHQIRREIYAARSAIGSIQECDMGKRVFRVADAAGGFIFQVENDEQRAARLGKTVSK